MKKEYKWVITEYIDNEQDGSIIAVCDTEEGAYIKAKELEDMYKNIILPYIPYNDWDKAEDIMVNRHGNCLNIDAYCEEYCQEFADILNTFGCGVTTEDVKLYWQYVDMSYKINHVTYIVTKVEYFKV